MRWRYFLLAGGIFGLLSLAMSISLSPLGAQADRRFENVKEARAALDRARDSAKDAEERAEKLGVEAAAASEAADKATREAAALAARIQQAEANALEAEARLALISDQRRLLDLRLAERRQPIVKLTAALQNMARRPLALSALKPGSLKDTVYVRAVLESTVPTVQSRTAALRGELERGQALESETARLLQSLRQSESRLESRRAELAAYAVQKRRTSQVASGSAQRVEERAMVLAENARDLNALVADLDAASRLRRDLAALPGPIMRPSRPDQSRVINPTNARPSTASANAPTGFQLPVHGRTLAGFGETNDAGLRSNAVTLSPLPQAQVVSPSSGRIAFADDYRGYGQIVIVEHGNGWTSLITGLGRTDVRVGDQVVGGSPLGAAPRSSPAIAFELRRDGEAVNPLLYVE